MSAGIEETVIFTPEQISAFARATSDTNPIHHCNAPVVPGLVLVLTAKRIVEENFLPAAYCGSLKFNFKKPAQTGTELIYRTGPITGAYPLETKVEIADPAIFARGEFSYSSEIQKLERISDERRYRTTMHSFPLLADSASTVADVIRAETPDYRALAIGLLSQALLAHGNDLVEKNAKAGRCPAYIFQDFTFFPCINELNIGDTLVFSASTRDQEGVPTRILTKVHVTKAGQAVYSSQTNIVFVKPATLSALVNP